MFDICFNLVLINTFYFNLFEFEPFDTTRTLALRIAQDKFRQDNLNVSIVQIKKITLDCQIYNLRLLSATLVLKITCSKVKNISHQATLLRIDKRKQKQSGILEIILRVRIVLSFCNFFFHFMCSKPSLSSSFFTFYQFTFS